MTPSPVASLARRVLGGLLRVAVYATSAVALTWPLVRDPFATVVGGERTDAYNSLWTYWFVASGVRDGVFPIHTTLLDFPDGGRLLAADPLNALLASPLTLAWGAPFAYATLLLLHLTFAGLFADMLGRRMGGRGWIAGIAYPWSAVVLAHLQNGSSEAAGVAWLPLSALACHVVVSRPGFAPAATLGAAAALAATALGGGWYAGLDAFLLAVCVAVFAPGGRRLWPALALGVLLVAPAAYAFRAVSTASDGLIDIKGLDDLARIRRTIGALDVRVPWVPGNFRAPNFARLAQNASDLVHTAYIGYGLLALALWKGRNRALWIATICALVLAHGPSIVLDGRPLAIAGRALPLPYAIVEQVPGFGSLSLLFRLATLVPLGLGLLADRAHPMFALVIVLETRLFGPAATLPQVSPAKIAAPYAALALAEPGAVITLPAGYTRTRLFEQAQHGKPLVGSINSGVNATGLAVLADLRACERENLPFGDAVARAKERGVRYVIVHPKEALETTFSPAVRILRTHATVLADDGAVRVYRLY